MAVKMPARIPTIVVNPICLKNSIMSIQNLMNNFFKFPILTYKIVPATDLVLLSIGSKIVGDY